MGDIEKARYYVKLCHDKKLPSSIPFEDSKLFENLIGQHIGNVEYFWTENEGLKIWDIGSFVTPAGMLLISDLL